MGERYAVGNGHAGEGMPQAVQRAEIFGQICRLLDGVYLIADVRQAAFAVTGREDIGAFASLYLAEQFTPRRAQRNSPPSWLDFGHRQTTN